ncbi:MAG: ABC transporter permease subunit [Dehalococcoidia bacterium]|nr:ABC transporter permease subunit [Dehalococcoidia bacterium]
MAVEQQTGAAAPPLRLGTDSRLSRFLSTTWRFARRKPLGAVGAAILVILVLTAILADVIAPYDPVVQSQSEALQSPNSRHLAGTDQFGRDMLSRLIHGARISIYVGVGATILSIVPAMAIGVTSAFFKGSYDYGIQRIVDAVQALPGLILLIAIVAILGTGLWNVIVALSFGRAFASSRIVRGAAFQVISMDYVDAARSLGATNSRIMLRHVVPNVFAPIIVVASLGFGQIIIAEASLSFLGFGIQPPAPSWGGMLAGEARAYMYAAPHILWIPALTLGLVVFGVNMFGDALRDVLDPRLRGS